MERPSVKILGVTVYNFGSYKCLYQDFSNKELMLVSGPTGAGKSTMCDAIPWVLYGVTAKNGSVDEVKSWNTKNSTMGVAVIQLKDKRIRIERHRNPNDLWYTIEPENSSFTRVNGELKFIPPINPIRGKDLIDTQKLINELLGIDADLYLMSSYLHEFSPVSAFFSTTARMRRYLTEQLVDLTLVTKLAENSSEFKKQVKKEKEDLIQKVQFKRSQVEDKDKSIAFEQSRVSIWKKNQVEAIKELENKGNKFEEIQAEKLQAVAEQWFKYKLDAEELIKDLEMSIMSDASIATERAKLEEREKHIKNDICPTCGNSRETHVKMLIDRDKHALQMKETKNAASRIGIYNAEKQLKRQEDIYNTYVKEVRAEDNAYLEQVEKLKHEKCPNLETIEYLQTDKTKLLNEIGEIEASLQETRLIETHTELLQRVLVDFRANLLESAVKELETGTNNILTKHFDAELRVSFTQEASDKLDITIHKDGNVCTYSQLSKGQRQLLKLSFGVSVMRFAALHNSISVPIIMLDEPSDGLSEDFKLKSFGLLQELATEYDTVMVIEHNEALKSMFTNRYEVKLVDGWSQIEKT